MSGTVGKDIERRNRAVFRNKIDGTGEVFLDHCLKAPEICRIDSGSIFRVKFQDADTTFVMTELI